MNPPRSRCPLCGVRDGEEHIHERHAPTTTPETVGALIERLERELADAKGDADRYRWLRSHPVFQVKELPNELELLDACIDRHMAGRETEE